MRTHQEVKRVLRLCRQSLIAVGLFSFVANLLMLVPAFFMLNVYDKAVGNNSLPTLWALALIAAFLFLILGAMEALRSRVLVAISSRLDQELSPTFYDLIFKSAVLTGPERATTQPLTDLNQLRQFLTSAGVFAVFDAPWLPVYIFILFLFHPLLGWLGVFSALCLFVLALANQSATAKPLADANQAFLSQSTETQRNLRNAEVASSMGMMPALKKLWRNRQDAMLMAQEQASQAAGSFNAVIKTLRLAIQSAAIAAGAFLVLKQEISPGMLIAGSILIGRALQPVETAVGTWRGFLEAKEQYSRLSEWLFATPSAKPKITLPLISGAISVKQAFVAPPGAKKPTIIGMNLELPAGTTLMILGASGAGKSTLVRAMLGLWPTQSGEIRIDGVEAFQFDPMQLGPQIGYLPQDIELLEGTVSENISRFGSLESDLLIQAAMDAGIHDFILSLPNGYDTELGKPGGLLSPGQRQRVALARAIYNRPKLVVLDEPNSNLDEEGEIALGKAVRNLQEHGSTIIIVSHRKSVISLADYVLIMASGKVMDFGTASEVAERLKIKLGDSTAAATGSSPQPIPRLAAPKTVPVNAINTIKK